MEVDDRAALVHADKYRRLKRFSDESHRFSMLAIDQRGTQRKMNEVTDFCTRLDGASRVPWVILGAGVDPVEFIENVRLANAAGAGGFLCGRAVWKHVIDHYPNISAMRGYAEKTARPFLRRICEANERARPWTRHPFYFDAVGAGPAHAG